MGNPYKDRPASHARHHASGEGPACECRTGSECEELASLRREIARHDRAITQLWAIGFFAIVMIFIVWLVTG